MDSKDTSNCSTFNFYDSLSTNNPISSSADDKIAVLCEKFITILTLSCNPDNTEAGYHIKSDKIPCPAMDLAPPIQIDNDVLTQWNEPSSTAVISKYMILNSDRTLLFGTQQYEGEIDRQGFQMAEWSPLGLDEFQRPVLAALGLDHRLSIYHKPSVREPWKLLVELSGLYHSHYLSFGRLVAEKDYTVDEIAQKPLLSLEDNCLWCETIDEYLTGILDMSLYCISWSDLLRTSVLPTHQKKVFATLVTMTKSGALVFWIITLPLLNSDCFSVCKVDYSLCCKLLEPDTRPTAIKVCDIDSDYMMIVVTYDTGRIEGLFYRLDHSSTSSRPFWRPLSPPSPSRIVIYPTADNLPNTRMAWSRQDNLLFVGRGPHLFVTEIKEDVNSNTGDSGDRAYQISSPGIITGDNDLEITGLQCRRRIAFASTADDFLIKYTVNNLSQGDISSTTLEPPRPKESVFWEYLGVYISANGVLVGGIERPFTYLESTLAAKKKAIVPRFLVFSTWADDELLQLLLNERIPFRSKRDAMEELRRVYAINRDRLGDDVTRLVSMEETWPKLSWHNLQLMRLLCQFLSQNFGGNESSAGAIDETILARKTRTLDTMIMKKHLSRCFDLYCRPDLLSNNDDAVLILRLVSLVRSTTSAAHMADLSTDAAEKKACLQLNLTGNSIRQTLCAICHKTTEPDLFVSSCLLKHQFQRCCQTLQPCSDMECRVCKSCGAQACPLKSIESASPWLQQILTRFCPLCDGEVE